MESAILWHVFMPQRGERVERIYIQGSVNPGNKLQSSPLIFKLVVATAYMAYFKAISLILYP